MIGLDTNILVRFLMNDDEKQSKKVYKLFKKTEADKTELFIPSVVILELIWVLDSAYNISRANILDAISDLLLMPILHFEHQTSLQQFIVSAQQNKYDLADLLIAHAAKHQGCQKMITFDKKAAKFNLFELLQ